MSKNKGARASARGHRLGFRTQPSADPTGNRAARRAAARQSPAGIAGVAQADRDLHRACPGCRGHGYANCPCCGAGHDA